MSNFKIKVFTFDQKLYNNIDEKFKSNEPDLVVSIGGDGTFINSVRENIDLDVPFYGVAGGTLNFLMNQHDCTDINKLLESISNEEFKITYVKTPTLKFFHNDKFIGNIVNEIVIGDSLRYYPTFNIKYNDKEIELKGSFISMATPLGSTGLNRNIKGTLIPSIKYSLYSLVSLASNKDLNSVVDETKGVNNTIIKKLDDRYETVVIVDNQKKLFLEKNDEIKVTTGKFITIGFLNYEEFVIKRISEIIEK